MAVAKLAGYMLVPDVRVRFVMLPTVHAAMVPVVILEPAITGSPDIYTYMLYVQISHPHLQDNHGGVAEMCRIVILCHAHE
jgi:hypothetical protein